MTWQLVAAGCWLSLLAVAVWVLHWRMSRDSAVSLLLTQVEELKRQLSAANETQTPTVNSTLQRMRFR